MKIICLGDSLTYGYGVYMDECWVYLIQKETGMRVLNRGINGDTTGYMLERARRRVIPNDVAFGDLVIIMGGANDALMYGTNHYDSDNILKIAEMMSDEGAIPIVGIQPGFRKSRNPFYGPMNVDSLNADFDGFAERVIKRCRLESVACFDLRHVLEAPELFSDGVHPTEEGHRLIAETVLECISPMM